MEHVKSDCQLSALERFVLLVGHVLTGDTNKESKSTFNVRLKQSLNRYPDHNKKDVHNDFYAKVDRERILNRSSESLASRTTFLKME